MPRRAPARTSMSAPSSRKTGNIRLISGQWKGRKLPVLEVEGLRPTTDRVKETLFNWLAAEVRDAVCLDLFAGSGSLGFEALSRYAGHVTMVEMNRAVSQQLTRNLTSLGSDKARVVNQDARSFLAQAASQYDVVFLDPPFHQGLLEEVCTKLETGGWLQASAWIYLERELNGPAPALPANWTLIKDKKAGQVCYQLYQREGASA